MSSHHAPTAPSPPRPGQSQSYDESTSSPVTACRRCRKQKLRCSRDLPTCKRCKDISALCEYPPPPDRKLLAAQRLQNAKARARIESESAGSQDQRRLSDHDAPHGIEALLTASRNSDLTEQFNHGGQLVDKEYGAPPPLQTALMRTNMPSAEVAMFLTEIYFARMYNAHLLFHKDTFLAGLGADRVPDFVALAVFASATRFLRQAPGKLQQFSVGDGDGIELGLSMLSAADWARQGQDWAKAAGQRAMMQGDIPRMEIVQACQCLALYWWAVGERERTHVLSHVAYINARLLGLHVQSEDCKDNFADEMRRRVFWACWINQCIGQENASFKSEPWTDAIGLKLASDEKSWHARRPNPKEAFDRKGRIVNIDGSEISPIPSEMGEFIKFIDLWWEVQRFLKLPGDDTAYDASIKIAGLLELDRRLGKVFDDLHPDLRYVNVATFTASKLDKYRIFSFHTLYRSTSCSLHSSVVPLFANTAMNPHVSTKVRRLSAEECVKHAAIILDMATALMISRPDISRLPSMVGFAMFVASVIQFKSLSAQRKLETYGTGRFKAAILILGCLKEYWDSLRGLWAKLRVLFAQAGFNIEEISRGPRFHVNSDDQHTDLEEIISHEGAPQNDDGAALYTYVANQEALSGLSPGRGPAGNNQGQSSESAQNAAASGRLTIYHRGQEARFPIHQRQDAQMQAPVQIYPMQQQFSNTQPPMQQFEQQSFTGAGNLQRQGVNAMRSSNFVPLGTVPGDYPAQSGSALYSAVSSPTLGNLQSTDAFGNMPGMIGNEMDVDRMKFWWDQSYELFDMKADDPNVTGPEYQTQNLFFDPTF